MKKLFLFINKHFSWHFSSHSMNSPVAFSIHEAPSSKSATKNMS